VLVHVRRRRAKALTSTDSRRGRGQMKPVNHIYGLSSKGDTAQLAGEMEMRRSSAT